MRDARARGGYPWSTAKAAAFYAAIVVLALVLAELLALVLKIDPGGGPAGNG